jgi:hypothetical protein
LYFTSGIKVIFPDYESSSLVTIVIELHACYLTSLEENESYFYDALTYSNWNFTHIVKSDRHFEGRESEVQGSTQVPTASLC